MKNDKQILIMTGMTEKQIESELKRCAATGKKLDRCYVCKRPEGERTVAITGTRSIVGKTIELKFMIRHYGSTKMVYPLCSECLALLTPGDEVIDEEKPDGIFIRFCRN